MKDSFGQVVGKVFVDVFDFLEELSRGREPDADLVRERFIDLIDAAEREASLAGCASEFVLAKVALVLWIDQVVTRSLPPLQKQLFRNDCLELKYYPINHRFDIRPPYLKKKQIEGNELFFRLAPFAGRDTLDVFWLCVALGYRGAYFEAEDEPLLRKWVDETYEEILGHSRTDPARDLDPRYKSDRRKVDPLRPLYGQHFELGVSKLVMGASAFTLIVLFAAICMKPY